MIDERLSTVSAARTLREAGIDAKAAKAKIDSASAVAILEQGLAIDKR
jgi:putative Holliday junction resolvase